MGKVSDLYRQRIASGALRHDDAQAAVLPHMDRVLDQLQAAPPQKPRSAWRAFLGVGSPDPVPAGAIELAVAAAQSAPSSSNLQPWSVVAVEDDQDGAPITAAEVRYG